MDPLISEFGFEIADLLKPWIAILASGIVALWLKDWITSFVQGAKFRMNRAFNESDQVILDGHPAHIVKIGPTQTVFGVYSDKGYTWRYVPNTRIEFLKLEKIVDPELHRDTQQEKAQKLVDAMQDARIKTNGEEISKLKNGDK